jgi:DtxR family Mn-dependent transcriptional regulator
MSVEDAGAASPRADVLGHPIINAFYRRFPMPSSTVEDYVKQLYLEQQHAAASGDAAQLVPMGRLAAAMSVVPGTATSMVKALADSGLVVYEPRGGVRLTAGGEKLALHVLRRHRLIELLLVEVLKLDWSEVHDEAEQLEHAVSDKVLSAIDRLLGHPSVDPHGDPIPSAGGTVARPRLERLSEVPAGVKVRIARVTDQAPAFLQFIDRAGLAPGAAVKVESSDAAADAITLTGRGREPVTLGKGAAAKVWVEVG